MDWTGIAGAGMGIALNEISHKTQLGHQKDFQDLQVEGQKQMGAYNQALGIDTWNKTNYGAQVEHLKKAGLNVGLMYQGGGAGGTTATPSGSNVTGAQAQPATANIGMGMQIMAQNELLKAQKENLQADTLNKLKDAKKKETEVPSIEAGKINVETDTKYKETQIEGSKLNNRITEVNARLREANESNLIGIMNEEFSKLKADRELSQANKIKVEAEVIRMGVENALSRSNIAKNQSEMKVNEQKIISMITERVQEWERLRLQGQAIGATEVNNFRQELVNQFNMDNHTADQVIGVAKVAAGAVIMKGLPNQPQEKYINIDHNYNK